MQIELKAGSREEFDEIIDFLKRNGQPINDVYEKDYKILITVSKTFMRRLRQEGLAEQNRIFDY